MQFSCRGSTTADAHSNVCVCAVLCCNVLCCVGVRVCAQLSGWQGWQLAAGWQRSLVMGETGSAVGRSGLAAAAGLVGLIKHCILSLCEEVVGKRKKNIEGSKLVFCGEIMMLFLKLLWLCVCVRAYMFV